MKKSLILVGMLSIGYATAQEGNVGINTENPKATLDINPNTENAKATAKTNEGIIAPRLTKARIAGIADANLVEGTLVYATDNTYTGANTKVAKITEKGYYFYNGTEWVRVQYKDSADSEWVYDDATKRINLKRSGIGDFKNKVYYNTKTGGFINTDTDSFVTSTKPNASVLDDISGHNKLIFNSKNISSIVGSNNRVLDKVAIILDKTQGTANKTVTGRSQSAFTESDDASSHGNIVSLGTDVSANGTGTISSATASHSSANANKGTVNSLNGSWSEFSIATANVGKAIGNASRGYVSGTTTIKSMVANDAALYFREAANATITDAIGYSLDTDVYAKGTTSIDNFYGFKHNGLGSIKSGSTLKNNYGLYIGGIAGASEKNYSIYTNTGTVYFGDKVGIRVDNPEERLEVAGNILAKNGGLHSSYNSDEGGYLRLINNKKKEADQVQRWQLYNMTGAYIDGLHFWAYGGDNSNKNSQMVLTDKGQLAIGFGASSPTNIQVSERLEVNGNAKIVGLKGTGDRPVYADANGVLKVGSAISSTPAPAVTIGSTADMVCNTTNRGKMNFVPAHTLENGQKADVFAICLKGNGENDYAWRYLYGTGGVSTGTGTFGSGL